MDTNHTKKDTVAREIAHAAARFIVTESNGQSLITVTHARISSDSSKATVYVSIIPESAEADALNFLKRLRAPFRDWIKKEVRLKRIPLFDFEIDQHERYQRAELRKVQ